MREIKFRAWDKKNKIMVYPTIVWNYSDEGSSYMFPAFSGIKYDDVDDISELMQYTGLKDKNGKEIYEGDIVRFNLYADRCSWTETDGNKSNNTEISYRYPAIGEVRWNFDRYEVFLRTEGGGKGERIYSEMEVIGDIYENPELLK